MKDTITKIDYTDIDPLEIEKANKSSRSSGAVGPKAVTPRSVLKYIEGSGIKNPTILDFGAGKDAKHTYDLRNMGLDVTAHDFHSNIRDDHHDPNALNKEYDIVFASNVLNVQGSESMLRVTIKDILSTLKDDGVFIANFPSSPRYYFKTPSDIKVILEDYFDIDIIEGTDTSKSSSPVWSMSKLPSQFKNYWLSEGSILKDIIKKGISKWFPANQLPDGFINKVARYIKIHWDDIVTDVDWNMDIYGEVTFKVYINKEDRAGELELKVVHKSFQHALEQEILHALVYEWGLGGMSGNFGQGPGKEYSFKVEVINSDKESPLTEQKEKIISPNIKGEMVEIERATQDLNRHYQFNVSVRDVVEAFEESEPIPLHPEIWNNLENTESNQIEIGDFKSVFRIADIYDKSNPLKLARKLRDGSYKYPLIVRFEDRYHLVAGNTRLSTAAALGITPMVFIADINKSYPVDEQLIRKVLKGYIG